MSRLDLVDVFRGVQHLFAHIWRVRRAAATTLAEVAIIATLCATPAIAVANPSGASVANGSAAFASPNATTLNITTANGTIINWQQFGINPGEVTRFLQQGGSAAVLNRVVGGDPSAILGSLLSNGRVFLINPNGVVFGANAVVDTAGLIVSTLNMSDEDFLSGRLHFDSDGTSGAIVNQGQIRAQGSVILTAPRIENSGLIETEHGGLLLAAGREVTITSFDNPEIAYQLAAPQNEVLNLGRLISNGGAASIFAGSIRHSGDINANSVVVGKDGRVQLVANGDVTLEAGSRISADGANGGEIVLQSRDADVIVDGAMLSARGDAGNGGDIRVLGERVGLLAAARLDASGRDGGGQVLVGGDYHGDNPQVQNARFTFVASAVQIAANAETAGNGGKVILWADDTTRAYGSISATAGVLGGDGGFVEISGKHGLVFEAQVDTTALAGASGVLLLDPDTINITDVERGPGSDDNALPVFTALGATTISEGALEGQSSSIILEAADGIVLENLVDNELRIDGLISGRSITLRTTGTGDITFQDIADEISTSGGDINLEASGTGNLTNIGKLTSSAGAGAGGNISLTSFSGNVDLQGLVQSIGTTSGDVFITATGGSVTATAAGSVQAAKLKVIAANGISMDASGTSNRVQQLTASNSSTGDIKFTNSQGLLTLAPNGTAFAVSNAASNGKINIVTAGAGAALTTNGVVQALNGGLSNQVRLASSGLLTIGAGSTIQSARTVVLNAADLDVLAAVSGVNIDVTGLGGFHNIQLGVAVDVIGNATVEVSQAEIDLLNASSQLSFGQFSSFTRNITVTTPINIITASPQVLLKSSALGIDFNAALNAGARNVRLIANGNGTGNGDGEIRQSAAGVITAGVLNVVADQAILLSGAVNQVGGFTATSNALGSSGIQLTNTSGAVALALNPITSTNANIDISNAGGTSITGIVDAGTATASITESTLDINNGGGRVQGASVSLSATNGGIGNGTKVITDAAAALILSSGGAAAAGNIAVQEVDAIASSAVTISTDSVSTQSIKLATATGNLTINGSFGEALDDLELRANSGSVLATSGTVLAKSLALNAPGAGVINLSGATFTIGAGGVSFAAGAGLSAASLTLSSSGGVSLNGGSGTLLIDNTSVSAGADVSANAALIDVLSGSVVTGNNVTMSSSGTTRVDAIATGGAPTSVNASNAATFNVGTLLVKGSSAAGGTAKIQAGNSVTITANDVRVQGGDGAGALASIDPATISINTVNDIVLQGGTSSGAVAEIVASNVVNLVVGGNLTLIGSQATAKVVATAGDVNITAGNAVNLTAGVLGDAAIVADSRTGSVNIAAASCANCVLLGADPFANATADQGAFAATLNLLLSNSAVVPALAVAAVVAEDELGANDVLVLEELAERLTSKAKGDEDEDEKPQICR
jgi:filamentous hemagglutinin family protein